MYLEGNHIVIDSIELKKHIGKKIQYLLNRDIDKSGRGYFFPRVDFIEDVYKKTVLIRGDYISFSDIREIILLDEKE